MFSPMLVWLVPICSPAKRSQEKCSPYSQGLKLPDPTKTHPDPTSRLAQEPTLSGDLGLFSSTQCHLSAGLGKASAPSGSPTIGHWDPQQYQIQKADQNNSTKAPKTELLLDMFILGSYLSSTSCQDLCAEPAKIKDINKTRHLLTITATSPGCNRKPSYREPRKS